MRGLGILGCGLGLRGALWGLLPTPWQAEEHGCLRMLLAGAVRTCHVSIHHAGVTCGYPQVLARIFPAPKRKRIGEVPEGEIHMPQA